MRAILTDTRFKELKKARDGIQTRIGTPYGPSPTLTISRMGGEDVIFLPRHGEKHTLPPHKINNRANLFALHSLGVERILATNVVGSLDPKYKPGDLVIPNDFIDFTRSGYITFYNEAPITHIDFSSLYCPELREIMLNAAKKQMKKVWSKAVYICTDGPRYESPAEIRMFRILGCDIIGMTGMPEAALAHELEMCYATMCFVSNIAAGIQKRVIAEKVVEKSKAFESEIVKILKETIVNIPKKRRCSCSKILEGSRI